MMQLSIIIVNYKSWSHLVTLIEGLKGSPELSQNTWEIIVVDNASGDDKFNEYQTNYSQVRFIENSGNNGFANANNLGAKNASGEFILFMNPDVIATPSAIRKLLQEKIDHPEIGLMTAPQLDTKGRLQKSFDRFPNLLTYFRTVRNALRFLAPQNNPDPRKHHSALLDVDWISGSLVLVSENHFKQIGGWSEDYWMYAEDMDLCKRADNLGLRRAITPITEFIHTHGGSSRQNPEVTLITKSEVMKSAHVYVQSHFKGAQRITNHFILVLRNLVPLFIASLLNLVSIGQVSKLKVRLLLTQEMLSYYRSVLKTGTWLSKRSVNYPI